MSVLALTVYVTDDNGDVHECLAGTAPCVELAEKIRNPAAWATPSAAGPAELTDCDGPPPRGGPGGSRQAWEAYARSRGLELEEGLTRDGVIRACERAGIAV